MAITLQVQEGWRAISEQEAQRHHEDVDLRNHFAEQFCNVK